MKLRFYVDVPEWHYEGATFFAVTNKVCGPMEGYTRVAFDVDMPPDVLKQAHVTAPAKVVGMVAE